MRSRRGGLAKLKKVVCRISRSNFLDVDFDLPYERKASVHCSLEDRSELEMSTIDRNPKYFQAPRLYVVPLALMHYQKVTDYHHAASNSSTLDSASSAEIYDSARTS